MVAQSTEVGLPPRGKEPAPRPRDYYRIEDEDGHRYWVFRDGLYQESALGAPSWYLHGVFGMSAIRHAPLRRA